MAGLAAAFGSGAMTNSVPEIEDADCVLIIGSNTTSSHPLVASRVMKAREKGAKIIVIDPRKTQIAHLADIYVPHNLGSDVALVNGLMHIILQENWHNKSFIDERTEGFEELKKAVEEYTPEKVEKITDVPKEKLREIADIYANSEKSSIIYCMGITQHTTGTDNVKSLANLAMLTGQIGRPSTGVNPLRGQNNVQGSTDLAAIPNIFPGYQPVADEAVRQKFEKAWGVSLSPTPGMTLVEMINAVEEGKLKALYIMAENPVVSDPDSNHVEKALDDIEFLVVQDIFLTETAKKADVVLPGASFAEKDGTYTGTDRRVQRIRKAIEPLGDAREDWKILCQVAQALGGKGFDYSSPKEVFDEIAELTPIYHGINYDRIVKEIIHWPCRSEDDPGSPYLHKDGFARGKGLFTPIEYKPPAELPDDDYPYQLTTGRIYFHFHTGTMTRVSPSLVDEINEAFVEIHPENAYTLGIKNGEKIRITSRRGTVVAKAMVTNDIREGVVFMPFHFAEAAANRLTIAALDPIAKIPEYKVCAVKIERLKAKEL